MPQTATIGRNGRWQWLIPGELSEEDVLAPARLAFAAVLQRAPRHFPAGAAPAR